MLQLIPDDRAEIVLDLHQNQNQNCVVPAADKPEEIFIVHSI